MSDTLAIALLLEKISEYSFSVLEILGATTVIGLGYLVFRFGWKKLQRVLNTNYHFEFRGKKYHFGHTYDRWQRGTDGKTWDSWGSKW